MSTFLKDFSLDQTSVKNQGFFTSYWTQQQPDALPGRNREDAAYVKTKIFHGFKAVELYFNN